MRFTDLQNFSKFSPTKFSQNSLSGVFDQLPLWTRAMESVREQLRVTA